MANVPVELPTTALPAEVVMLVPLSKVIGLWAGVTVNVVVCVPVHVNGAAPLQATWACATSGKQTASTIAKTADNTGHRPRRGAL
jgi:hypothetical protein